MNHVNCPAATLDRGPRGQITRCGVEGFIREAKGSPCCGDYTVCAVWRKEKERHWLHVKPHIATEHIATDGSLEWR